MPFLKMEESRKRNINEGQTDREKIEQDKGGVREGGKGLVGPVFVYCSGALFPAPDMVFSADHHTKSSKNSALFNFFMTYLEAFT